MKRSVHSQGRRRAARAITAVAVATGALFALGVGSAAAQTPVSINVVDVAGNLALTQDAIQNFANKNPKLISKVSFTKAPAPELPGKLKAMQAANRSDIDLVLTGTDFLAAGIEQGLLVKILPDHSAKFPNLMQNYQPAAAKMQELAGDYGIEVAFMPAGPLLENNPGQTKNAPTTPQHRLAWSRANPGRRIYARPTNSGPGGTYAMGLPYIRGDKEPKKPASWDNTQTQLKDLNSCIEYYPRGTRA